MTTDFKPAIEELQDFVANLSKEELQAFHDVPFDILPIDSISLGHILQAIPEGLQRRYEAKILQLKRLNALARIRKENSESADPNHETTVMHTLDVTITDDEKSVDITYKIGNTLLEKYKFKTTPDTKEIYRYDDDKGIWVNNGSVFIEDLLKKNGLKLSSHNIKEIIYHVQTSTYEERSMFKGVFDGNMLHVENGWLNMDTLELEPHTLDRLSIAKITTPFDKKAGPVEFVQVLNQAQPDPQFRRQLLKAMGNILIHDTRFEKATMLVGDGHNRKGTMIKAIIRTVGQENCCHVSPQELAEDRFAAVRFYNKILNAVADLKADKILNTGRFKELVSGDVIEVQEKYGQRFPMENHAKMLFSANDIPPSSDQTDAYFRRWCIIPFHRTFERDPTIQERLSTEKERSGILNLMLYGRRLLIAEGFDDIPLEKVRRMYNRQASLVKDFLDQDCILDLDNEDPDNRTLAEDLQKAYIAYQEKLKDRKFNESDKDFAKRQLGQELDKLGVEHRALRHKGSRPYFYLGIVLKSQARKGSADVSSFT